LFRIRSRRYTIVIRSHVLRQKYGRIVNVYGRKRPYTECVNLDLGAKQTLVDHNIIHHSPIPVVKYKYFVVQHGDKFKLLGSCSNVQATSPMSRCLVKIYHKYDFFQMDINEMKGTGIVIHKNNDYILIVTAFHVIIPQYILTFNQFITMNFVTLIAVLVSWYFKLNLSMLRLFIYAMLYSLLCCTICFLLLAFFYPMLCVSSFQIETVNKKSENQFSSMDLECQVVSSTWTFSQAWWDDIGK
jgi:hypothetical protein